MSKHVRNFIVSKKSGVRVHGNDVIGCVQTKSDLMLSFGPDLQVLDGSNKVEFNQYKVVDVFISEEQAINLFKELDQRLNELKSKRIKGILKI